VSTVKVLKLGKIKLLEHVAYLKEGQEKHKYFSRRNILRIVSVEGRVILKCLSKKPAMRL
jgi:hypothetical protein